MSGDSGRSGEPPHDESLNEALDDLEGMLEGRRAETRDRQPTAREIPLLDDVVEPGTAAPSGAGHAVLGQEEYAELCRRIAERLASEMEILVNDRLEQAMKEALGDAQRSIRNHLDIVLPEIVEELRQSTPHADD